jgi:hypothetical protein
LGFGNGDEVDERDIGVAEDIGLSIAIGQWEALTSEI